MSSNGSVIQFLVKQKVNVSAEYCMASNSIPLICTAVEKNKKVNTSY